jgi:hypothetical protein
MPLGRVKKKQRAVARLSFTGKEVANAPNHHHIENSRKARDLESSNRKKTPPN